jgi:hypothetical protein
METTETTVQEAPIHYNPNQLVTYKVIDIDDTYAAPAVAHYPTEKVTEIEWQLEQGRRQVKKTNALQSKINRIIDNMTEDYWYNPNTDISTVLEDLCEILEHNPVKNVEFTATIRVHGSIEIPIAEAVDFDLETYVFDALSIDSNSSNLDISDWDVEQADEC